MKISSLHITFYRNMFTIFELCKFWLLNCKIRFCSNKGSSIFFVPISTDLKTDNVDSF